MSPAQIQNIRETREKQLEEKQVGQQMRQTMDKQWDDERIRQAKVFIKILGLGLRFLLRR